MIYIFGITSIILGVFLTNIVSKVRDNNVSQYVSKGDLVDLQLNKTNEEDLRAKYSPGWLNLLALLPLPLVLGGMGVIIYNLWQTEILWVKIALVYGLIGLIYANYHVKNIDVGASGQVVTFLSVSVLWPLVVLLYIGKYLWDKRSDR
ncbi:MAG: hypothetical protein HUJ22_12880 [Gracilimonas sp.]|uniref:hypothetical protein n=1 Tax=Gracilimonas sp. TaxID=1974203 RepID=UPI0019B96272|nr:hypothetical protein [Gracilimonas sp.]MBD3617456.1 hypothetical protein [Gracilimonas sp.]